MCKWCKWVLVWGLSLDSLLVVSLLICRWLFHCWWIFLRWWMFYEGRTRKVGSGLVGLIGWGDGWVLAEGVLTRVYAYIDTRSFVLCCHKCHSGWNWKYFIIPKTTYRFIESDVSFYWKHSIVLSKTSCHFIENIVSFYRKQLMSFYGKQRVVLDWRSRKVVLRMVFWGFLGWSSSVKVWQCGKLFLKSM